jgi:nucleoside-diphosphate-sugar epimerase
MVAKHLAALHDVVGVDAAAGDFTNYVADITKVTDRDWQYLLDGVEAVVHFAALHAPHRATHSTSEFVRTNVDATSRLYDETKLAAEQLCREAFSPDFVTAALRFSRSFPEPLPSMALYRLYRGVDARDVAQGFAKALEAQLRQFEALNISAATPFLQGDCHALFADAPGVLKERCPSLVTAFVERGWALPQSIDRVYVIDRAREILGYAPAFSWRHALGLAT